MVGVRDCLTKSYGSTNQKNLCKAVFDGLKQLRSKEQVAELRGVEISASVVEEILTAGKRYAVDTGSGETKAQGPVNTVRRQKPGGRGGRGGRGRGQQQSQPVEQSAPAAKPAAQPATEEKGSAGA